MDFKKWLNLWDTQALLAFVSLSLSLRKVRREFQKYKQGDVRHSIAQC
jgi:hypothetical protein